MKTYKLHIVATLLVVAAMNASPAFAEDQATTGVLKGVVLSSSGSPLGSVTVRLYVDQELQSSGGAGAEKRSISFVPAPLFMAKGKLVRTVITDASGKFEAKALKVGAYTYRAGDPMSVGYKFGRTQVEAGKTTEIELKLDAPMKR